MDTAISNINQVGPNVPPIPLPGSASNVVPQKGYSGQAPEESRPIGPETSKQLLQAIQSQLQSMNVSLSFSKYGKNGDDIAITVKERDTGKVIREIPPEDLQNLYTKLGELIGVIFNHPA